MGSTNPLRWTSRSLATFGALALLVTTAARAQDGAAGSSFAPPTDRISPATHQRIADVAERNATQLGLSASLLEDAPALAWPLRADGIGYASLHGFGSFVDHEPAYPDELLDYDCGARTYDTADGYNHRGIDIFPWPYGWRTMDFDRVRVVAAAPGVLVAKDDGHEDRRCSCLADDPNYVIVQHADGSRAWYLHLKDGSVTGKAIGEPIAVGEVLGTVGSSGCSSGVHLHFEVHAAGPAPGALLDPFDGVCNQLNPQGGMWAEQPAYRDPTINHLTTNAAPPDLPPCPGQEIPNEKRVFAPGDDIHFMVFLHDETPEFEKTLEILRPDGTVFWTETHTSDGAYDASFWSWWWTGDNAITSGPTGRWTWRVSVDGTTESRAFWVGAVFADDFEDANLDAWATAP